MAFTGNDSNRNADLFRLAYPHWPHAEPSVDEPIAAEASSLAALRDSLTAAGATAASPVTMDPEAE